MRQDGVCVNCVCPEFTDTAMVSKGLVPDMQQPVGSVGLLRYMRNDDVFMFSS